MADCSGARRQFSRRSLSCAIGTKNGFSLSFSISITMSAFVPQSLRVIRRTVEALSDLVLIDFSRSFMRTKPCILPLLLVLKDSFFAKGLSMSIITFISVMPPGRSASVRCTVRNIFTGM